MFRREWHRFKTTWPVEGSLGPLENDSEYIAHADLETSGPGWQVSTRYDFLRLGGGIRANMAQPYWRQLGRTARWIADDVLSGALFRLFGSSVRMGVLISYSQVMLMAAIAASIAAGWYAAKLVDGSSAIVSIGVAAAAGLAVFAALKPVIGRMFVNQLNNCWTYLREFARGAPTGFDQPIDVFARRVAASARSDDPDEIIIVGHSAGAMLALAGVVRALELDPDVGRRRPRIVLMTVGSPIPALALHPAAAKMRNEIARLAVEPSVLWVDCQAGEDFMNFWDFDAVAGSGVEVGEARCNPLRLKTPFQKMISPQYYARARWDFFRMHYQYIMSNDRRAAYDYFMMICGPAPVSDWVTNGQDTVAQFALDAAYAPAIPPRKVKSGRL